MTNLQKPDLSEDGVKTPLTAAELDELAMMAAEFSDDALGLIPRDQLSRLLAMARQSQGSGEAVDHRRAHLNEVHARMKVNGDFGGTAHALSASPPPAEPVKMILHCPSCGLQHIDEPDERTPDWSNPPHRSHLCHGCGHIWRPADVPTEGVASITTVGKNDSPPPPAEIGATVEEIARLIRSVVGVNVNGNDIVGEDKAARLILSRLSTGGAGREVVEAVMKWLHERECFEWPLDFPDGEVSASDIIAMLNDHEAALSAAGGA